MGEGHGGMSFELRTLGGLEISASGRPLTNLTSRKARALLVYVLVEGKPLARESLAALFWPESSQQGAAASLRVELSKLKACCGDLLDISRETVKVRELAAPTVDVSELQRASAAGRHQQVADLYRGPFLQGFGVSDSAEFEDWRGWQQERVQRLALESLRCLTEGAIERGAFDAALASAHQWLRVDPYVERAHRSTMLALARAGRRAEALAHYETCRTILRQELGVEPGELTCALAEAIRNSELGETLPARGPGIDLPQPPTALVGRSDELAELLKQLTDPHTRLVTLVGPGGVGKTRLALQAARPVMDGFPDGVYFVPAGTLENPAFLPGAIAAALGFTFDTLGVGIPVTHQLLDYLASRKLLLVLDGFEGLLAAVGLLSEMISHAPRVTLLVTSQERLRIQGEWALTLDGLPVPASLEEAGPGDALALFEARATQAREGRDLPIEERRAAIRICCLVQGLPLAIELAAAWTRALSCREIAAEIESDLDFLATDMRDAAPAHRSLRAVFNRCWNALAPSQQSALQALSVFRGGFERAAALAVCGSDLSMLAQLLDKSLLRRNALGRFDMHAVIQHYARELLAGDSQALHAQNLRHSRFFRSWLADMAVDIMGVSMMAHWQALRPEMDNLRAALEWAVLHEEAGTVRAALADYFTLFMAAAWTEGHEAFAQLAEMILRVKASNDEAIALQDPGYLSALTRQAFFSTNLGWLEESDAISRACLPGLGALDMAEERSICLHNLGVVVGLQGNFVQSIDYLEQAIALGDTGRNIAWPSYYIWLGHTWYLRGEFERSRQALEEAQRRYLERGSPWAAAFALSKLGLVLEGSMAFDQAMECQRQALEIFRGYGDRVGQAYSLSRMSVDAYGLGDYDHAVDLAEQGFAIFRELGHRWGILASRCRLGFAYLGKGDRARSRDELQQALQDGLAHKLVPLCLYALIGLASCFAQEGELERAGELLAFVRAHPETLTLYLDLARRWLAAVEPTATSATPDKLEELAASLSAGRVARKAV